MCKALVYERLRNRVRKGEVPGLTYSDDFGNVARTSLGMPGLLALEAPFGKVGRRGSFLLLVLLA